jgi:hypothetical protein
MGVLTVISSLTFWGLHADDGDNISNRRKKAASSPQPSEAVSA